MISFYKIYSTVCPIRMSFSLPREIHVNKSDFNFTKGRYVYFCSIDLLSRDGGRCVVLSWLNRLK